MVEVVAYNNIFKRRALLPPATFIYQLSAAALWHRVQTAAIATASSSQTVFRCSLLCYPAPPPLRRRRPPLAALLEGALVFTVAVHRSLVWLLCMAVATAAVRCSPQLASFECCTPVRVQCQCQCASEWVPVQTHKQKQKQTTADSDHWQTTVLPLVLHSIFPVSAE